MDKMDQLIRAVAQAIKNGASIEEIHDTLIKKGWSESETFLAIKAGQNLHNHLLKVEEELKNRPLPFGRKS